MFKAKSRALSPVREEHVPSSYLHSRSFEDETAFSFKRSIPPLHPCKSEVEATEEMGPVG